LTPALCGPYSPLIGHSSRPACGLVDHRETWSWCPARFIGSTTPATASPARSLIAASPDRSNCLSKHHAAGITAGNAPQGHSDRNRASRQNSPLIEAGRARCASSTRQRRQHVAAACSTSPRILRVATPSASTAISAAEAAAAVVTAGSAVAIHYRGFALTAPCGPPARRSRGRRWNICRREGPRSDCLFDVP
jgi:hypothetical protein